MLTESWLRINTPNVVGEEFDGEVVVVNLESGCYFSLMGSAKEIWNRLTQGSATREAIVADLEQSFDCTGHDVATVVSPFLNSMIDLELLVLDEPATTKDMPGQEWSRDEKRPPFQVPRIETFTDLQDILLLDPIHDVDEAGWPMALPKDSVPK